MLVIKLNLFFVLKNSRPLFGKLFFAKFEKNIFLTIIFSRHDLLSSVDKSIFLFEKEKLMVSPPNHQKIFQSIYIFYSKFPAGAGPNDVSLKVTSGLPRESS